MQLGKGGCWLWGFLVYFSTGKTWHSSSWGDNLKATVPNLGYSSGPFYQETLIFSRCLLCQLPLVYVSEPLFWLLISIVTLTYPSLHLDESLILDHDSGGPGTHGMSPGATTGRAGLAELP